MAPENPPGTPPAYRLVHLIGGGFVLAFVGDDHGTPPHCLCVACRVTLHALTRPAGQSGPSAHEHFFLCPNCKTEIPRPPEFEFKPF